MPRNRKHAIIIDDQVISSDGQGGCAANSEPKGASWNSTWTGWVCWDEIDTEESLDQVGDTKGNWGWHCHSTDDEKTWTANSKDWGCHQEARSTGQAQVSKPHQASVSWEGLPAILEDTSLAAADVVVTAKATAASSLTQNGCGSGCGCQGLVPAATSCLTSKGSGKGSGSGKSSGSGKGSGSCKGNGSCTGNGSDKDSGSSSAHALGLSSKGRGNSMGGGMGSGSGKGSGLTSQGSGNGSGSSCSQACVSAAASCLTSKGNESGKGSGNRDSHAYVSVAAWSSTSNSSFKGSEGSGESCDCSGSPTAACSMGDGSGNGSTASISGSTTSICQSHMVRVADSTGSTASTASSATAGGHCSTASTSGASSSGASSSMGQMATPQSTIANTEDNCKHWENGYCSWGAKCRFQHTAPGLTGSRRRLFPSRHIASSDASTDAPASAVSAAAAGFQAGAASDEDAQSDAGDNVEKAGSGSGNPDARWIWRRPAARFWVHIFLFKRHDDFDLVPMLIGKGGGTHAVSFSQPVPNFGSAAVGAVTWRSTVGRRRRFL